MREEVVRLEKVRNMFRALMMGCIALELVAFVMIVAGLSVPGVVLGVAAMAGHIWASKTGKRRYGDECARVQARTLQLDHLQYVSREAFDGSVLHKAGLISSALKIDSTLKRHALKGEVGGVPVELGEITFGVVYPGQNKHEFNSGVLLTAPLSASPEKPVLLMGHNSVRHKLIRKEYEDDGWKLCNVGGKTKGWYVFTPDGAAPEEALLSKLDELSQQAEGKVLLSLKDGRLTAFFLSNFYIGEYPMGDPVEEKALREKLFHHLPAAVAVTR